MSVSHLICVVSHSPFLLRPIPRTLTESRGEKGGKKLSEARLSSESSIGTKQNRRKERLAMRGMERDEGPDVEGLTEDFSGYESRTKVTSGEKWPVAEDVARLRSASRCIIGQTSYEGN